MKRLVILALAMVALSGCAGSGSISGSPEVNPASKPTIFNADGSIKDPCAIIGGSEFTYVSSTGRSSLGTVETSARQTETGANCGASIGGGNGGPGSMRLSYGKFPSEVAGESENLGYKCQEYSAVDEAILVCNLGESKEDVWILFQDRMGATSPVNDIPALRTMMEQTLELLSS